MKGLEGHQQGVAEDYPYKQEELAARIASKTLPMIAKAENLDEVEPHLSEVYAAYPKLKSMVNTIKDSNGGNPGNDIQAFPWVPVIIVYTLIAAYGLGEGYRDGSNAQ